MENLETNKRPVKKNGYSNKTLHAKRDKRRKEAIARLAAHNKLTIAQKLEKASKRGGKREIARLTKLQKAVK
jgi:hypothetical protein